MDLLRVKISENAPILFAAFLGFIMLGSLTTAVLSLFV